MTLEQFKAKNKTKNVSKLDKYEDEILDLYNSNHSQKSIVSFLAANGVTTSRQNVGKCIQKILKNQHQLSLQKQPQKSEEVKKTLAQSTKKEPQKETKKSIFKKPSFVGIDTEIKDARKEHPELFDN